MPPLRNPLEASLYKNSHLVTIASNSGWLLLDKLVRLGMGLTVGAIVARYLGPSQYGELAFVIAVIAIFQPVCNLGADGIVVRDLSRSAQGAPAILGSVFLMRIAVSSLCWFSAIGFMAYLKSGEPTAMALASIVGATLVLQASDTADLWFQANSQNRRAVLPKLVGYIAGSLAKLVAVFLELGIVAIAAMFLLDAVLAAFGLFVAYRAYPAAQRWRWDQVVVRQLMRQAWPFMLSGIGTVLYMRIDQILLDRFLGSEGLGMYAAAVAISSLLPLVPMSLYSSVAPYIAQKKAEGEKGYQAALEQVFAGFGILALVLVLPVALFAEQIIAVLFGGAYSDSAGILVLHVFANVFIYQGVAQGLWFINEKAGRLHFLKTVVGVVLSVVGNLILIPRFGPIGAALVAVFVQFVSSVGINMVMAPYIFRTQLRCLVPVHLLYRRPVKVQ